MINRVVLVGRLTQDPSLRKTQSGISVVSFTVACNRRFSGGNGQDRQADFIWKGEQRKIGASIALTPRT